MKRHVWLAMLLGLVFAHPAPAQVVQTEGGRWGLLEAVQLKKQLDHKDLSIPTFPTRVKSLAQTCLSPTTRSRPPKPCPRTKTPRSCYSAAPGG